MSIRLILRSAHSSHHHARSGQFFLILKNCGKPYLLTILSHVIIVRVEANSSGDPGNCTRIPARDLLLALFLSTYLSNSISDNAGHSFSAVHTRSDIDKEQVADRFLCHHNFQRNQIWRLLRPGMQDQDHGHEQIGILQESEFLGMSPGILMSMADPRKAQTKTPCSSSMISSIQHTAFSLCYKEFDV